MEDKVNMEGLSGMFRLGPLLASLTYFPSIVILCNTISLNLRQLHCFAKLDGS